jgi:hypothetical protein
VDDIESDARKLRGEWLDTLDRVNRLAQRVAKRAERELKSLDAEAQTGTEPAPQGDAADRILAIRRGPRVGPGRTGG